MLLLRHVAVLSSVSGLEGEVFGMGLWALGLGAVGAALTGIFLANTDLCLSKAANATLQYLEDTDLHSTTGGKKTFSTKLKGKIISTRINHGWFSLLLRVCIQYQSGHTHSFYMQ